MQKFTKRVSYDHHRARRCMSSIVFGPVSWGEVKRLNTKKCNYGHIFTATKEVEFLSTLTCMERLRILSFAFYPFLPIGVQTHGRMHADGTCHFIDNFLSALEKPFRPITIVPFFVLQFQWDIVSLWSFSLLLSTVTSSEMSRIRF